MSPCQVDQGDHTNTSGDSLPPIDTMERWTPSKPFGLVQAPHFRHLFAHFINPFRDLRPLKSDQVPLFETPVLSRLVVSFRNSVRRLIRAIFIITYRTSSDRDKSKKTSPPDQINRGNITTPGATREDVNSSLQSDEVLPTDDQSHHSPLENRLLVPEVPVGKDLTSTNIQEERLQERDAVAVDEAHETRSLGEVHLSQGVRVTQKVRKRALLIGVRNNRMDGDSTPAEVGFPSREHRDVEDMRALLEDLYGYDPDDITCLVDDGLPEHIQPTRENIVLQIGKLVEGAKEKDRIVFHFVGHSEQEATDDDDEEDGMNEFILTSDGKKIMDDELRRLLVDSLPTTCSLTAVFDSCHSCSLLDLPHFRCNRVYVPWLNRGKRRTDTILAKNQRKLDIDHHFEHLDLDTNLPNSLRLKPAPLSPVGRRATEFPTLEPGAGSASRLKPMRRPRILTESLSEPTTVPGPSPNSARHYASPICLYCHGNCRQDPIFNRRNVPAIDVICLSSSKDSQLTWVRDGSTMTQFLIKMLRAQPKRTLKDVLTIVSHDIHRYYIEMHDESRDYKRSVKNYNQRPPKTPSRKRKEIQACKVEMHNFQDPQISSFWPLDMNRFFEL